MTTSRSAILIAVSVVLLLVSIALLYTSKRGGELKSELSPDGSPDIGSIGVQSDSFKSFLIRSDNTSPEAGRQVLFGEKLFDVQANGDVSEIHIPEGKGVLSAQYSPNGERVLASFCEFEGLRLCGLYMYTPQTNKMVYITEHDKAGDYANPVWITESRMVYLRNTSESSQEQSFVPFMVDIEDISEEHQINVPADTNCLYADSNSHGEFAVGCFDGATNITTVLTYGSSGDLISEYDAQGIVLDVEISDDTDVFILVAPEDGSGTTAIYSITDNLFLVDRAMSMDFLASGVYAYTDSLLHQYFIASSHGAEEVVKSPGKIILDSN